MRHKMSRKRNLRTELIRSKLVDIEDSVSLVEENLPSSYEEFSELGLVKDGIYKRMEFAIENIIGSSLLHVGRLNWIFPSLRYIIRMRFFVVLKPLALLFAD